MFSISCIAAGYKKRKNRHIIFHGIVKCTVFQRSRSVIAPPLRLLRKYEDAVAFSKIVRHSTVEPSHQPVSPWKRHYTERPHVLTEPPPPVIKIRHHDLELPSPQHTTPFECPFYHQCIELVYVVTSDYHAMIIFTALSLTLFVKAINSRAEYEAVHNPHKRLDYKRAYQCLPEF